MPFDMSAYDAYFAGKLEDVELSQSRTDATVEELPAVPAWALSLTTEPDERHS